MQFEIKAKDISGRIGNLTINGKKIETPALMPVYNVNNPILTIDEIKNFGIEILMTNAYIIYKDEYLRNEVLKKGIHDFLKFDGIIATDSGSYQLMKYGGIDINNEEILKFENDIKADIGSFLDIPTIPYAYKKNAEKDLEITLQRAEESYKLKEKLNLTINAAIQGSTFLDLRKKSAKFISKKFKLNAIGGIVPLMENYKFEELVDIIVTIKKNISSSNVVHAFGLGHPIIFGLAVALGCDIFDSAAYALFAKDGRYLTENGTKKISEMKYLPCNCEVCRNKNPEEMTEKDIAKHNLNLSIQEIKKIKEAINEQNLWEYVESRSLAHPNFYNAVKRLKKYRKFLAQFDPITKKRAFFDFGFDCRTEIYNVRKRIKNVKSKNFVKIKYFGNVPEEILDIYPFTSCSLANTGINVDIEKNIKDLEKIKSIMDYQFGKNARKILDEYKNLTIKYSKQSGRMRYIYAKDNDKEELIGTIRAHDSFIIPHGSLINNLHKFFKFPKLRVVIKDDAVPFVKQGKNVFAKFVIDIDKNLLPGDECLVVDEKDNLISKGVLFLSYKECLDFDRGVAVKMR